MRILISNDDGYSAPGILALRAAFENEHEVWLAAPAEEQSGASHKLSFGVPLRAKRLAERTFAVSGTPTDAVYLAIHHLMPEPPELVLSGINRGVNAGDDITYSGTVAVAIEGAILGLPALAFSLELSPNMDYVPAALAAKRLVQMVIAEGLPKGTFLNVNIPAKAEEDELRFAVTHQGARNYDHSIIERPDPRGEPYYWIGGNPLGYFSQEGSDCDAIAAGLVSVTPLCVDLTHRDFLPKLGAWFSRQ